jgi:hypothetical protein
LGFKESFDWQARAQFAICSLSRFDHFTQDNRCLEIDCTRTTLRKGCSGISSWSLADKCVCIGKSSD